MSQTETVNLRAAVGGDLIGTASFSMPDDRSVDDEPKVLNCRGRLFRFVSGTFAESGAVLAEYVEVFPFTPEQVDFGPVEPIIP